MKMYKSDKKQKIDFRSLMSAKSYLEQHKEMYEKVGSLLEKDDIDGVIELIQMFSNENPTSVEFLVSLYETFLSRLGHKRLVEIVTKEIFRCREILGRFVQKTYKTKQYISSIKFNDLEDIIEHAMIVKYLGRINNLENKPYVIIPDLQDFKFPALLPYLEEVFDIVTNPYEIKNTVNLKAITQLDCLVIGTDLDNYGAGLKFVSLAHEKLYNNKKSQPVFNLKPKTEAVALDFLSKFGISPRSNFVVLNLSSTKNERLGTHRFEDYELSIRWLIEQGYHIINFGSAISSRSFKNENFVNLSEIQYPGEVDIFSCAKCNFFMGANSGHARLSQAFDTYQFLPNEFLLSGTWGKSFAHFIPLHWEDSGEQLLISDFVEHCLLTSGSSSLFPLKGISLAPLGPNKLLEITQQMIQFLEKSGPYKTNAKLDLQKKAFGLGGWLSSDTLKLL